MIARLTTATLDRRVNATATARSIKGNQFRLYQNNRTRRLSIPAALMAGTFIDKDRRRHLAEERTRRAEFHQRIKL
jgi:hypothetical protein